MISSVNSQLPELPSRAKILNLYIAKNNDIHRFDGKLKVFILASEKFMNDPWQEQDALASFCAFN